ncbi:MAG TPA: LysR family transcriptional regulator [Streptosporangiaceae bacterium]
MDPSRVDLNRVDLNLLVAFDALMCEHSVTRAARRLSVGQSAMSSTLGRLRKLFDDPLLIRDGRGMVATSLAESLAKQVRDVLERIESILADPTDFDPAHAERTFAIIASDVTSIVLVKPLRARLAIEAPGIRVQVSPPAADDAERLTHNQADVLITPRDVFPGYQSFRHTFLFSDRLLCAVDVRNEAVGQALSVEQFSSLPYLATTCGRGITSAEAQLDRLGISRNTEFSTTFGMVPTLVSGSQMIALVQERFALAMADQTTLRLLEPPMPLQPTHQLMLWTSSAETDPGHTWLRRRIVSLVAELDETTGPQRKAGAPSRSSRRPIPEQTYQGQA